MANLVQDSQDKQVIYKLWVITMIILLDHCSNNKVLTLCQIKQDCWQQHQFPWKVWQKICHWSTWVAKKLINVYILLWQIPYLSQWTIIQSKRLSDSHQKQGNAGVMTKFSIWYVQDLTDAKMHDHLWTALLHSPTKTNHVGKNLPQGMFWF